MLLARRRKNSFVLHMFQISASGVLGVSVGILDFQSLQGQCLGRIYGVRKISQLLSVPGIVWLTGSGCFGCGCAFEGGMDGFCLSGKEGCG